MLLLVPLLLYLLYCNGSRGEVIPFILQITVIAFAEAMGRVAIDVVVAIVVVIVINLVVHEELKISQ